MNKRIPLTLALAALVAVTVSCDSSPTAEGDSARVQILLTDEPADYLAEAWVRISRVYLLPGEEDPEEGPPFVDLFHDPDNPLEFDLLTLQDGVIADITGEYEVPAGSYAQLRMIVSEAWVVLADGYEFVGGDTERELFVPSGAQTGIKVMLDEPIAAEAGTLTVLLVDFDVNQNFVLQGNPDTPGGLQGVLFTPMLRELNRDVSND
jgi:hypothetical protein